MSIKKYDPLAHVPPSNKDAEAAVIGAMIRENDCIGDVIRILSMESFYWDAHQKIWDVIVTAFDKGDPVDILLVMEELKRRKQFEDIGGAMYLAQLMDASPTGAINVAHYADIVREKFLLRSLIFASTEIARDAYEQFDKAEELLSRAETKILAIQDEGVANRTSTLSSSLISALDRIDERSSRGGVGGLATRYHCIDILTGGLHSSELIVVGARPSVGKTSIALNLSANISIRSKVPSLFVSLEMSKEELAERLLCREPMIDGHLIRTGNLGSNEFETISRTANRIHEAPIFIDDSPNQTVLQIAASVRRHKARNGVKAVFIDYLQLIEPEDRRIPRNEQVALISRRLKQLARETKIPIVCMAQLNRESENRTDQKPRMSDLRESGAVEQDADTIMLLHRLEEEGKMLPEEDIDILIEKQRNGPTGIAQMRHLKQYGLFEERPPQI